MSFKIEKIKNFLLTKKDREITLTFNSTYLPSGSFGNITIQCLNLETQANTTRTCTRSAERITCTCNGGSLVPSTEYAVSLFTIKNGLYRARELYLRDVFTSIVIRYFGIIFKLGKKQFFKLSCRCPCFICVYKLP